MIFSRGNYFPTLFSTRKEKLWVHCFCYPLICFDLAWLVLTLIVASNMMSYGWLSENEDKPVKARKLLQINYKKFKTWLQQIALLIEASNK